MANNRGIDTIKLYATDFVFNPSKVIENFKQVNQPLSNTDGEVIKSYYNTFLYDTENKKSSSYHIGLTDNKLDIQLSIPKFITNGSNYDLSNKNDIDIFKSKIQKRLNELYIDTDIDNLQISRVDITNNATMEYDTPNYITLLRHFEVKRIKQNNHKNFDTSILWYNTNKAICIYDKIKEITKKDISNILRNEVRFFKNKNIQKVLRINTLKDLKNNFESVCSITKQYEIDNLLNYKNFNDFENQTMLLLDLIIDRYIKENGSSKNIIKYILINYGIRELIKQFESVSNATDIIINSITKKIDFKKESLKVKKSRFKKELTEINKESLLIFKNENNVSYKDLYNELLDKLVA